MDPANSEPPKINIRNRWNLVPAHPGHLRMITGPGAAQTFPADEALVMAAYLVAISDPGGETFAKVHEAVRNKLRGTRASRQVDASHRPNEATQMVSAKSEPPKIDLRNRWKVVPAHPGHLRMITGRTAGEMFPADEALVMAAYLVAIADPRGETFAKVHEAVCNKLRAGKWMDPSRGIDALRRSTRQTRFEP